MLRLRPLGSIYIYNYIIIGYALCAVGMCAVRIIMCRLKNENNFFLFLNQTLELVVK